MKILIFSRYSRLGASSRLRSYQFIPFFQQNGIDCDIFPFFNDQYLKEIYEKKPVNKWNILKSYFKCFLKLARVGNYDAVIVEKELFPFLPAIGEWWLKLLKIPYIADYDDAIFHNYDLHPNKLIKYFLSGKIKYVMRHSEQVVAGNSYLQQYSIMSGAKKTVLIPTVIDIDKYPIKEHYSSEKVVIGWIGSPTSLKYLKALQPVLKELGSEYNIQLHIVGGKSLIGLDGYESLIEWTETMETKLVQQFDIGIMPLENNAWERGKCGYKLIQYMGCALPVVGSPVGVNDELIEEGINGFKPRNFYEWKLALEQLIVDSDMRSKMGKAGRKLVEEKYSLQKARYKWVQLLNEINNRHA